MLVHNDAPKADNNLQEQSSRYKNCNTFSSVAKDKEKVETEIKMMR